MSRDTVLYRQFLSNLGYDATPSQDRFFTDFAAFLTSDDGDIFVLNVIYFIPWFISNG